MKLHLSHANLGSLNTRQFHEMARLDSIRRILAAEMRSSLGSFLLHGFEPSQQHSFNFPYPLCFL